MDVTAQRQADSYRAFVDAPSVWVLAPLGRSTGALHWQGPGHRSAEVALDQLVVLARQWAMEEKARAASAAGASSGGGVVGELDVEEVLVDASRVLFTGHSNGGFGAFMFASHYPDKAVAVAPLAGMTRLGQPPSDPLSPSSAASSAGGAPLLGKELRALLEASAEEYNGRATAVNLRGVPFLARTGSRDNVISPASSKQMLALVQQKTKCKAASRHGTGGKKEGDSAATNTSARTSAAGCRLSVLPGKEHWWWDTDSENDGGAVFDPELRSFFTEALARTTADGHGRRHVAPLPRRFTLACLNPATCGGRGGVTIEQMTSPFVPARMDVRRKRVEEGNEETGEKGGKREGREGSGSGLWNWSINTVNVHRIRIVDPVWLREDEVKKISLDGEDVILSPHILAGIVSLCRNESSSGEAEGGAALLWGACRHQGLDGRVGGGGVKKDGAQQCAGGGGRSSASARDKPDGHGSDRRCDLGDGHVIAAANKERGPRTSGPLRRIFEGPLLFIVGTTMPAASSAGMNMNATHSNAGGPPNTAPGVDIDDRTVRRLQGATRLVNLWFGVTGGIARIALDTDVALTPAVVASSNLVLLGGPASNGWAAQLDQHHRGGGRGMVRSKGGDSSGGGGGCGGGSRCDSSGGSDGSSDGGSDDGDRGESSMQDNVAKLGGSGTDVGIPLFVHSAAVSGGGGHGGYQAGPCWHPPRPGLGAVTLSPGYGAGRLAAVVDGVDSAGFEKAMRAFEGALFEVNVWQLLAPDYMVLGSGRTGRKRKGRGEGAGQGWEGWGSVESAGYWGHQWQYVAGRNVHRGCGGGGVK